jgi:hypothetical protein
MFGKDANIVLLDEGLVPPTELMDAKPGELGIAIAHHAKSIFIKAKPYVQAMLLNATGSSSA